MDIIYSLRANLKKMFQLFQLQYRRHAKISTKCQTELVESYHSNSYVCEVALHRFKKIDKKTLKISGSQNGVVEEVVIIGRTFIDTSL